MHGTMNVKEYNPSIIFFYYVFLVFREKITQILLRWHLWTLYLRSLQNLLKKRTVSDKGACHLYSYIPCLFPYGWSPYNSFGQFWVFWNSAQWKPYFTHGRKYTFIHTLPSMFNARFPWNSVLKLCTKSRFVSAIFMKIGTETNIPIFMKIGTEKNVLLLFPWKAWLTENKGGPVKICMPGPGWRLVWFLTYSRFTHVHVSDNDIPVLRYKRLVLRKQCEGGAAWRWFQETETLML